MGMVYRQYLKVERWWWEPVARIGEETAVRSGRLRENDVSPDLHCEGVLAVEQKRSRTAMTPPSYSYLETSEYAWKRVLGVGHLSRSVEAASKV